MTITITGYGSFGTGNNIHTALNPSAVSNADFKIVGTVTASQAVFSAIYQGITVSMTAHGSFDMSKFSSSVKTLQDVLNSGAGLTSTVTGSELYIGGVLAEVDVYNPSVNVQLSNDAGSTLLAANQMFIGAETFITSSVVSGGDQFYGYSGVATFYENHIPSKSNSDLFVGGTGGVNTMILPGASTAYNLKVNNSIFDDNSQSSSLKGFSIAQVSAPTITLANISSVQRIQYGDNSKLALDTATTQAAGQTALLLGAALPGTLALDPTKQALVGAVIGLFDAGFTLQQLSGALLRLPVWDALTNHTNATAADIATYLVHNAYGGTETAAITNAAIAAMTTETPTTQGTYLASLAQSSTGQSHIGLVGLQTSGLAYV